MKKNSPLSSKSRRFSRRVLMLGVAATLALYPPVVSTAADDAPKIAAQPNKVRGDEITDRQKAAVAKGLEWLAKKQRNDPATFAAQAYSNHAGITALAGLAFMQA